MALLGLTLGEVELVGLGHGLEHCWQIFGYSGQGLPQSTLFDDGIEFIVLGPIPLERHYGRGEHLGGLHGRGRPAIPAITPHDLVQAIFIETLFNELYMMDQSAYNVINRLLDPGIGFIFVLVLILLLLFFYLLLFDALDLQFGAAVRALTELRHAVCMD